MAFVEIKELTFKYNGQADNALCGINFSVKQGSFTVICGKSGCGKTTLLRHLKPEIAPFGTRTGSVTVDGKSLYGTEATAMPSLIGFVMQDPDNQIVTDKVWHELAFGLESIGADTMTIRRKTAETASFFGIQDWYHRDTASLSGGQKQLLNLAAIMVMSPDVLVLDEPTSRLDPIAASEFLSAAAKLNRELGTTIIMTEHRLDDVLPLCSEVAVMKDGHIIFNGAPNEAFNILCSNDNDMFLSMPAPMRIWSSVSSDMPCPITVSEGRAWFESFAQTHTLLPLPDRKYSDDGEVSVNISDIYFKYNRSSDEVLNGLSLKARAGQILTIIGGNGTGKSTLLSILCGMLTAQRGNIKISGRTALLPQDPKMMFLHSTVYDELADIAHETSKIADIAKLCDITEFMNRHPYDLSGGEMQRVALAKILLTEPDILLMDEPTKGFDAGFKLTFSKILNTLKSNGKTIIIVSHDIEFCAEAADEIALLFDGIIVSHGKPREFFSQNNFYTTAASRIARNICPMAVTTSDVIAICGGKQYTPPHNDSFSGYHSSGSNIKSNASHIASNGVAVQNAPSVFNRMTLLLCLFVFIPTTLYSGVKYFGEQKYLIISMLILFETAIPFVLAFERRKPRARELIVIAVLCAIAIAGRAAFSMLPQFKPVLAIVIITGASLGAETGALVGAIVMFVSNMLFSQGIWTPWQMMATGIVGFLSGVVFYRHSNKNRIALCIFGIFSAIIIYGGIMNPASVLMYQTNITSAMIVAAYVTGFPLDLIHAAATVIFLWFLSHPIMDKLDRIKTKYGLMFT